MKKEIHPKYHDQVKVTCSCGETFSCGSTVPEIKVEICHKCHPFYTGKQKFVETYAGRIDKFEAKRQKQATGPARKSKREKRQQRDAKRAGQTSEE